jgi:hypothetical protein
MVQHRGQVKHRHKAPDGYDHIKAVGATNATNRARYHAAKAAGHSRRRVPRRLQQQRTEQAVPLVNLDDIVLSLTELEVEKARILRENWDVLDPSLLIPTYFEMCVGSADHVSSEPGRFLHNFGQRAGKRITTPMVKYAEQTLLGYTIFSSKETLNMGWQCRLVYESDEIYQACQVEEFL